MSEFKYLSGHEDQSKFIADKMVQVGNQELTKAVQEGRLHNLKEEDIPAFLQLVHAYYSKYQRYTGGGAIYSDFNFVISDVLRSYFDYKKNPDSFKNYKFPYAEEPRPGWASLLEECHKDFAEAAESINLDLPEGIEKEIYSQKFIDEPLENTFVCLGNEGPFGIGRRDENGVVTLITYFDEIGNILPQPKIQYFDQEKRKEMPYPEDLKARMPKEMPFEDERMVEAILAGKPLELNEIQRDEKDKGTEDKRGE